MIIIPNSVTVKIDGQKVHVKGPKGELERVFHPNAIFALNGQEISVSVKNPEEGFDRGLWGLSRVLISNMITGVTDGFSKKLEIAGIGFKAQVQGNKLVL